MAAATERQVKRPHAGGTAATGNLKLAFAGQLVAQDPTDEPAAALLARIRTRAPQTERKMLARPRKRA